MGKRMMLTGLCGVLGMVLLTGCAGMGGGPSDEELIMQQVQALAVDFKAVNADKLLDYVSDDFENDYVSGKEELAEKIEEAKDMGRIEEARNLIEENNGEIDLEDAEITIEDGIATVYPILASADPGSVTVELTLKKDPDKVWRVIGVYIEGI